MEKEIWKTIPGFDTYQISNFGNVKSLNYGNFGYSKLLKIDYSHRGYGVATLTKNEIHYRITVHRLVAQNFIDNPENKPEVNHIDGNPSNNYLGNLEWCTRKENMVHLYKKLGYKNTFQLKNPRHMLGKHGENNKNSKPVDQFTMEGIFVKSWDNAIEAQKALHVFNICKALKGKQKHCGGFIWRYK